MTSSGLGAPKIAVPATMTLLPVQAESQFQSRCTKQGRTSLGADTNCLWANTTINFDILVGESGAKLSNLWNTPFDKLLSTPT